jgi:hypothetical protein
MRNMQHTLSIWVISVDLCLGENFIWARASGIQQSRTSITRNLIFKGLWAMSFLVVCITMGALEPLAAAADSAAASAA